MSRGFTARHMWVVMIGFFGLVVAVNFTMAWLASSTFGGTVVNNSYVASQQYNGWLRAARAQQQLGWQTRLGLDDGRRVVLAVTSGGEGRGYAASGTAHHPLGRAPDVPLVFSAGADGVLHSAAALPDGRWQVRIVVSRDGKLLRLAETLQ